MLFIRSGKTGGGEVLWTQGRTLLTKLGTGNNVWNERRRRKFLATTSWKRTFPLPESFVFFIVILLFNCLFSFSCLLWTQQKRLKQFLSTIVVRLRKVDPLVVIHFRHVLSWTTASKHFLISSLVIILFTTIRSAIFIFAISLLQLLLCISIEFASCSRLLLTTSTPTFLNL